MPDSQPPIPPEAVEAAARAAYDRARVKVVSLPPWDEQTEGVKDMWREDAEAAIRAALPHLPQYASPSVEVVAEVICNAHTGAGCKSWADEDEVWRETYRDMARAALALLPPQPTVAEVREQVLREVAEEMEAEYERRTFKAGAYGQMKIRAALRMGAGMIRARIARAAEEVDRGE